MMSAPNRVAPALGDETLNLNLGRSTHDGPEWCSRCTGTVLTMNRNGCSRWGRNGADDEPEWVLTMGRNTQTSSAGTSRNRRAVAAVSETRGCWTSGWWYRS